MKLTHFRSEDADYCFSQLVGVLKSNEKIREMQEQAKTLEEKWQATKIRLDKKRRERKTVYVVPLENQ
jgi:hypothetical protein